MPTPRRISDLKPVLANLAQTSHYQVIFGGLSSQLTQYLSLRGVDSRFIGETVGLLCDSASLPGSTLFVADISNNYTGITEAIAHTRGFTQIDLSFYVDRDYRTIKFIEHWMEFISSGSGRNPSENGYFMRMQYPNTYKTDQTKIIKFDRDYQSEIEYTFYGLFPRSLNYTQVSYNYSDILSVGATFQFDRYVCGKTTSFDYFLGNDNNKGAKTNTVIETKRGAKEVYSDNPDFNNPFGVINSPNTNDFGSNIAPPTISPAAGFENTFVV